MKFSVNVPAMVLCSKPRANKFSTSKRGRRSSIMVKCGKCIGGHFGKYLMHSEVSEAVDDDTLMEEVFYSLILCLPSIDSCTLAHSFLSAHVCISLGRSELPVTW